MLCFLKFQKFPFMLLLVLFATFIFSSSFEKFGEKKAAYKLTADEKAWMEPLFRGVMLQNQAIYTLCGSKPMTMIPIGAEDEFQSNDHNSRKGKKDRIVMEDYRLLQNWENWEQVRSKFQLNRFAFFKKKDSADLKSSTIYFVDLTKVALALQENYTTFKREIGFDFDPLSESLKIEQGSEFWGKIFDNPALLGILLGYGIKNSFCFQWKYSSLLEEHQQIAESLLFRFSDKPQGGKATFDKLSLPIFASFCQGEDEVIEKYKREREMIKTIYEDKDFLTVTFQMLTQVDQ